MNQIPLLPLNKSGDTSYSPLVAIVGRPNVGKSSLFNRLMGNRTAVVSPTPGTTRDRIVGEVRSDNRSFTLVDTGGLEPAFEDPINSKVRQQVFTALGDADLILFVTDGEHGLSPIDSEIASQLRYLAKPLLLVVNKVDNVQRERNGPEFHSLGLGDPILISAYHNLGVYDLVETICRSLPVTDPVKRDNAIPKIALVGRTNVGKSMLANAILGQNRSIVSEVAGTTRDSLDTPLVFENSEILLIDTAGIRRRGHVEQGIEKYSVLRALRAIQRCDVAFMIMDASELATSQDAHVFGYAMDAFKGLVAVINKWDLVEDETGTEKEEAIWTVRRRFHFMPYIPISFTSGFTGAGIQDLLRLALDIYSERHQSISHADLRRATRKAVADHLPASTGKKKVFIKDIRQVEVNPPTFVINVNDPHVHFSYRRYLENRIRESFNFRHTHLRLVFKRSA